MRRSELVVPRFHNPEKFAIPEGENVKTLSLEYKELMKTLLLTLFCNLLTLSAFATLSLPTKNDYESGHFLCEQKYADILKFEKGFYVTVPVDYGNPQKGTTDIYAHFAGDYDPARETLFYFTGGPGLTSHWGLFDEDMGFNVLVMEQRGIACSRPETHSQFLDVSFYSSEFVARDAEKIRAFLKIPKMTVYGVSYGTVPATIYASLFPQTTTALILEGTVNDGDGSLWAGPHRRKLLQKMIDTLPANIKDRMEKVHTQYGYPDTWLSTIGRNVLMDNDGLKTLKNNLLKISDDKEYQDLLENVKNTFAPITYTPHILFTSNDVPYFMISCQELGLSNPDVTSFDALTNGKLVPKVDQESIDTCIQLKTKNTHPYASKNFPVKVPVTYFQGSDDSATTAPGAFAHYKAVPQGPKQLLVLVRGGHNPNLLNLRRDEDGQKEMFLHAFKGQSIPKDLLDRVQKSQELRWTYTSKNF